MRRFLTRRWLGLHALLLLLVAFFAGMDWWQWHRAFEGNARSWAYAFLWPMFAGFVIYMWVREVRDELHSDREMPAGEPSASRDRPGGLSGSAGREVAQSREPMLSAREERERATRARAARVAADEEQDAELAAYNRYLAELDARAQGTSR